MKKLLRFPVFLFLMTPLITKAQGELFSTKLVLNQAPAVLSDRYFLRHPFELLYGPDDSLWISERRGSIIKVDPLSGKRRVILDIKAFVKFTTSGSPVTSISQDGMMGMALHPDFPLVDSFFIAYAYDAGGGTRKLRISRFPVKNFTITARAGFETVIIENIPASTDHSSGRLLVGPDRNLYYAVGDQGANQFALRCNPNRAQDVPTVTELANGDYNAYQGKILRMKMDGTIPSDNPVIKSIRSHIFTFGHRNPNSLVFQKNGLQKDFSGAKLYSAENGPAEDDEINLLQAGMNYGWPYISGYQDNSRYQYKNWSSASNCSSYAAPATEPECATPPPTAVIKNELDTALPNFKAPIRTFFTPAAALPCNWLSNPTVAPSSIDYYGFDTKIPGWQNSLLMTTLKEGTLFRLKLDGTGGGFVTLPNGSDTARYFREENRFRDLAIGKDGITIYMITDSIGQTSGPTTGNTNVLNNRGSILVYKYLGTLLSLGTDPAPVDHTEKYTVRMYPNPTTKVLFIEHARSVSKPIRYFIYDMTGRKILEGKSFLEKFDINVAAFHAGTYIIKMYNGRDVQIATEKFVVR